MLCILVMLVSCARVASTICSGHPSARAAAASFSMTCSLLFSLLLAVSMRQVDIASKAAFTALRASSESPGTDIELKLRGFTAADLFCMAASPLTDRNEVLQGEPRVEKASRVLLAGVTAAILHERRIIPKATKPERLAARRESNCLRITLTKQLERPQKRAGYRNRGGPC